MLSGIQTAVSALRALSTKQDAVASNIANMQTPGYTRAEVTFTESPGEGVTAEVRRDDTYDTADTADTADTEPDAENATPAKHTNADPLTDITDSLITLRHTEAASVALKTSNEMLGSIIDITR